MMPDDIFFTRALQEIKRTGKYRKMETYTPLSATHIRQGNKIYLQLASNNYLGLTHNANVCQAAAAAIENYGAGSGAARLITGSHPLYEKLEKQVAAFKKTEQAIVFNSGYAANLGIISALMQENDMIFSDALNHASIIDGCRLSSAETVVFPHADMQALEKALERANCKGKKLIVTDGVFSMDGDIAPLNEIVRLAERHKAMIMVDDAHATGILGNGQGTAAHFGLEGKIDIQMGTLSKALGAEGAFAAASEEVISYLVNRARSYIFTTALAPAVIAAASAAISEIQKHPELTAQVLENAAFMRRELAFCGIKTNNLPTPIIPILIGDTRKASLAAEELKKIGIVLTAVRPPSVPEGSSRLRLTVSAVHKKQELAAAAKKVAKTLATFSCRKNRGG